MHIRKRSISILTLALIVIVHSGCASMNAPGEDKVSITTIPPGAKVYDGSNLSRVSRNAAQLLSFGDPATFCASLEVI